MRKKTSKGAIVLHTFLVLITGGLWVIPLGIWFLLTVGKR